MGKNYYCDFCDKRFKDNGNNRKNHLRSAPHKESRRMHYNICLSAKDKLLADITKKPCQHFFRTGTCGFEDNCLYSHLTPDRRAALEKQVEDENMAKKRATKAKDEFNPSLEDWFAKRAKRDGSEGTVDDTAMTDQAIPVYHLPEFLQGIPNLPPSVLPPTAKDIEKSVIREGWG